MEIEYKKFEYCFMIECPLLEKQPIFPDSEMRTINKASKDPNYTEFKTEEHWAFVKCRREKDDYGEYGGCPRTAPDLHDWLRENDFKIIRKTA